MKKIDKEFFPLILSWLFSTLLNLNSNFMVNELTCTTFLVVILISLGKYKDSIARHKTYIIIIQLIFFVYSLYTFFWSIYCSLLIKKIVNRIIETIKLKGNLTITCL